jgi:hypothetical protein
MLTYLGLQKEALEAGDGLANWRNYSTLYLTAFGQWAESLWLATRQKFGWGKAGLQVTVD